MKHFRNDLDVDFIGGQGSLTVEEQNAISAYIKQQKIINNKSVTTKRRKVERTNSLV